MKNFPDSDMKFNVHKRDLIPKLHHEEKEEKEEFREYFVGSSKKKLQGSIRMGRRITWLSTQGCGLAVNITGTTIGY